MKAYWIKGKKRAKSLSLVTALCLLLCGCQNMMNLADGQGAITTGDTEVVSSTEGGVPSFDNETVFRDIEDATGLAGILNEIVAKGQLYPVKAQEVQKNFSISAKTKNGSYAIYKVIVDGQLVLAVDVKNDVTGDASVEWFDGTDWKDTQYEREGLELKAGKLEIVLPNSLEEELYSERYEAFYQLWI